MTKRDSIVWRPDIESQDPTKPAAIRARENRIIYDAPRRRGIRRLLRRRAAARAARNATRRAEQTAVRRRGGAGQAGKLAKLVTVLMIVYYASKGITQAVTGKSSKNLEANARKFIFGEAGTRAQAQFRAKAQLSRDPNLAAFVAERGVTGDVWALFRGMSDFNQREIEGALAFETDPEFQYKDNFWDQLIDKVRTAAKRAWSTQPADPDLDQLVDQAKVQANDRRWPR